MENHIEITNGTRIVAYPKTQQPESTKQDRLAPDTTGEYRQHGKRRRRHKERSARDMRNEQLFVRNVHRLIATSDKILSDSRLSPRARTYQK